MGLSPTNAGLSLVAFMVALNTSAGVAGQVLGRVRRYKLLPMIGLTISIAAVASLAWRAGDMTPLSFELTLVLVGAGFGPLPSLSAVAMQNVVARHQLGISVGTMNFSRNLYATMMIAVFGRSSPPGAPAGSGAGPEPKFGRAFFVAAASRGRVRRAGADGAEALQAAPRWRRNRRWSQQPRVRPCALRHLAVEQLRAGRLLDQLIGVHDKTPEHVGAEGGAERATGASRRAP